MTELEKAARMREIKVCPYEYRCSVSDECYLCQWGGASKQIRGATKESFVLGAQWQAKQSPWIRVEERLPKDNELVLTSSSIYGTKLLIWNDFHKVWDDEDGDDTYCDRDKIDAWMPIPE